MYGMASTHPPPAAMRPDLARTQLDALYTRLRAIARGYLRRERAGHTLQPTALVHEAWIRLLRQHSVDWRDADHVQALAAQSMRRILVDSARRHRALKRGGGDRPGGWDAAQASTPSDAATTIAGVDVLALDEVLSRLGEIDPVLARIVELRFFGGCSIEQIARRLDIPRRSVDRSWAVARAWLHRAMQVADVS